MHLIKNAVEIEDEVDHFSEIEILKEIEGIKKRSKYATSEKGEEYPNDDHNNNNEKKSDDKEDETRGKCNGDDGLLPSSNFSPALNVLCPSNQSLIKVKDKLGDNTKDTNNDKCGESNQKDSDNSSDEDGDNDEDNNSSKRIHALDEIFYIRSFPIGCGDHALRKISNYYYYY